MTSPARTPEEWAQVVRADLGRAVEGLVVAGQHLAEAKAQIPYGGWQQWCRDEVGISDRMARYLITIGENPVLSDRKRVSELPPRVGTLIELARMEPEALEAAIADGRVTRDMERMDAQALVINSMQERRAEREPLRVIRGRPVNKAAPPTKVIPIRFTAPDGQQQPHLVTCPTCRGRGLVEG